MQRAEGGGESYREKMAENVFVSANSLFCSD